LRIINDIIIFYFGISLFANSILFIPQIIKILKEKKTDEFSITTFVGFCLTQLASILYGYIQHDWLLMWGYILALITCGTVTVLIFVYRNN
jgi:MtN3 and saliva related transmembrane protein